MLHEDEVSPAPAPKLEAKRGSQHRISSPTYGHCSSKDIYMRVRTILCPNGDRCKLSQKQSAEDQPTSHARAKPAPSSARARNTHHQALALVAEGFLSKESQRRSRNISESITAKCVNRRDLKLQKLDFNGAATVTPDKAAKRMGSRLHKRSEFPRSTAQGPCNDVQAPKRVSLCEFRASAGSAYDYACKAPCYQTVAFFVAESMMCCKAHTSGLTHQAMRASSG